MVADAKWFGPADLSRGNQGAAFVIDDMCSRTGPGDGSQVALARVLVRFELV